MFKSYIIQPLLTVSMLKSNKVKEATVFTSKDDIQLKCSYQISSYLIKWYKCVKNLPINYNKAKSEVPDSNECVN